MSTEETNPNPTVYRVIGAPGTGKTTRVVGNPDIEGHTSLVQENLEEYPLDDQLIVTYTKAATEEAADRLYKVTDNYKYEIEERVTTIHSQCYHLCGMDNDQLVRWHHKKQFCDQFDLTFGYDDGDEDIMGAEKDEGNAILDIYNWLQSNRKDMSEWEDCPADAPPVDDVEWYLNRWEEFKETRDLIGFGDMIEKTVELGYKQLSNLGYGIPFPGDDVSTKEMFEAARDDPSRDPSVLRGKGAFVDTKVLYVDEVQDLTPLQWEWYLLQKLVCEKVYLGGDDDQCLPPNAPVECKVSPLSGTSDAGKEIQKPIKDVAVGDLVRTMESGGEYTYKRVENVKKEQVADQRFKVIETETGRTTAVTDNHKMFAHLPPADYEPVSDKHYVYLMRDGDGNWRIGETSDLRQRMNVERGARCIVPLGSFDNKEEALVKETEWSLKYSVPQITIQQRDGEVLSEKSNRAELYSNISPQYDLIERDFGVDLRHAPFYKKSVTRGDTSSINIGVKMCADSRGGNPLHKLYIYTSDDDAIRKLSEYDELNKSKGKNGAKRFRLTSGDLKELGNLAEAIQMDVGGDIVTDMAPTEDRKNAIVTPAGNLVEGMLVPATRDGEVVWEEIVDVRERTETTEVYDLTVPGTHNFTTAGLGVHNTIYGWAGANPEFMLDEEGDIEVLDKTYRIPREVWEVCDDTIQQVDKRQDKRVEPHGDGGEFTTLRNPSPRSVIDQTEGDLTFILFRARYMIDDFREDLHELGIPYRNMSTHDTWTRPVVETRDALNKLINTREKLSGKEVDSVLSNLPDKFVSRKKTGNSTKDALNSISGKQPEQVEEMINVPTHSIGDQLTIEEYMNAVDDDELNYYEQQAIKGAVKNERCDLDPEKIKLGTIHSSKGREAETVIVATDSTQTIRQNMMDELKSKPHKKISDAERRVYYVGMTRAANKLVLAQGIVDGENAIDIADIVGEEHTADEWEVAARSIQSDW